MGLFRVPHGWGAKGLNATHYFVMRVPNKRKFQQTASNYSSDIGFEGFMKLYKNYTNKNHIHFSE